MGSYFKPFRRKVGVVTLVPAWVLRHGRVCFYRIYDIVFNYPDIGRYDPSREASIWEHRTTMRRLSECETIFTKWKLVGRSINEMDDIDRKKIMEELEFSRARLRETDEIWEYDTYGEIGLAAFRQGRLVEILACYEVCRAQDRKPVQDL